MRKTWKLILLLGLLAAACGGAPKTNGPEIPTPASTLSVPVETQPAVQLASNENQPAAYQPAALPTAVPLHGPGDLDLSNPATGLEKLPGYQAVFKLAFDGEKDGQVYQATKTYTLTVQRDPSARLLVAETSASDGASTHRLFANLAGVAYRQEAAEGPCQASLPNKEDSQALFEPARLLPHLSGAESGGEEALDGVPAQILRFDTRALGLDENGAQAEGTAWVARQGGYLLRYSLRLSGGEALFGAGMQGEQTWEYRLAFVGPEAIQLPEACPQEIVELAPLPDAQNAVRLPGFLRYVTSQEANGVSVFYTEQLAPGGWQPAGDPVETAGGTRWLYKRLSGEKEQSLLLTTRPVKSGLEVTLAVLP